MEMKRLNHALDPAETMDDGEQGCGQDQLLFFFPTSSHERPIHSLFSSSELVYHSQCREYKQGSTEISVEHNTYVIQTDITGIPIERNDANNTPNMGLREFITHSKQNQLVQIFLRCVVGIT